MNTFNYHYDSICYNYVMFNKLSYHIAIARHAIKGGCKLLIAAQVMRSSCLMMH